MIRTIGGRRASVLVTAPLVLALVGGCGGTHSAGRGASSTSASASSLLAQGLAAQANGQIDVARELYQRVLQVDPNNKYAHYDLGVIAQQADAVDDAAAQYGSAIAADPGYKPALFNLAVLKTDRDPAEAAELYRRLLSMNPQDANVLLNLGLLLLRTGERTEGEADLAAAMKIDPSLKSRVPSTTVSPVPVATGTPSLSVTQ